MNWNNKYLNWVLILLSGFLLVHIISGLKSFNYIGKEIYPQATITASGSGESYAIPDIATFSFSMVESAKVVKDAQSKVDDKISQAIALLKQAGIDEKDIKTTDYNVYPKYEWQQQICAQAVGVICPPGKNILTGYEVNETITVKVRDTSKAGDLVTKIGTVGVSNISGVDFTVDDKDKYVALAREDAIAKAKANAAQMAKDLGVRLGKILSFNESGNYPGPIYSEAAGMGGGDVKVSVASAQLPTGETKITSNVSITYEIK